MHEGVSELLLGRALETNEMMCAALDTWDATSASITTLMDAAPVATSPRAAVPDLLGVLQDPVPHSQPPAALLSHPVEDGASPPLTTVAAQPDSFCSNNPFSSANDLTTLQGPDIAMLRQELQALRMTLDDTKAQHAQQMAAMRSELEGNVATMRAHVSALRAQLADERRRAEDSNQRIADLSTALSNAREERDEMDARMRCVLACSCVSHASIHSSTVCLQSLSAQGSGPRGRICEAAAGGASGSAAACQSGGAGPKVSLCGGVEAASGSCQAEF